MAIPIARFLPGVPLLSGSLHNRVLSWCASIGRFPSSIALAASVVFGVPFALFYRLILFHFYVRGSFLLDTGLLASLMWHNTAALTVPASTGGFSFFEQHVSPILVLVSAVSYWLPLTMPQLFAAFVGLCHGILALAVLWLLVSGYGLRRGRPLALAALASVAFAFNGQAIAIVRYPHFETFGAACLLLFFVALVLERRIIAVVAFLFAIATREDVGLHAFGFLAVWVSLNWLQGVPWRQSRWIIGFAIAGLVYSSSVLLLQHHAFPNASSFGRVYLGDPPWSQVSVGLVADRLLGWVWLHCAIIVPAAAAVAWSVRTHNPYIVAAYIACLPWALLHLLAASDLAGLMFGYYAYPFLIALAWPSLAVLIQHRQQPAVTVQPTAAAVCLLGMTALSLIPVGGAYNPGWITLPEAFVRPPSATQQALTDRAVAAIASGRPLLGRLVVDTSVAALLPRAFPRDELAGSADGQPDTVVFLAEGFDAKRLRAVRGLPVHEAVPGTAIRIMTDRPASTLREIGIAP
ncbi:MAG: hypothetical protein ABSE20_14660 [Acetobacteraceae bacterium]